MRFSILCTAIVFLLGTNPALAQPGIPDLPDYESAQALLEAVEAADEKAETVRATINYFVINTLAGDLQRRDGEVAFRRVEIDDQTIKQAYVRFDQLIVGGRLERQTQVYKFDGRWGVEFLPGEKQFTKYDLVPPGQKRTGFDDLGALPVWLPMNQSADRILGQFDAELRPRKDLPETELDDFGDFKIEGLLPLTYATQQVRLTPIPGGPAEKQWTEVRVWFNLESLQPVLSIGIKADGDWKIVALTQIKINAPTLPSMFDTTTPTDPTIDVVIQPWRGE